MDNEKYGIELELITTKFNEKMEKIKNSFSNLGNKKDIKVNVNTAQIEYLKQQIKEISALLDYNAKKPFMNYNDVLKYRVQLEKLNNQYNKLIGKQKEVSVTSGTMHINMTKGFDKVISKIKRFGLALLSVRSIYSLVSRASSAYLSQDTELANKLQGAWAGLGALLAPILEKIADIFIKAVKYINIFIKALTGVDLLAKATAKSINKTTASAKGLNKALAGFDELTNLDTETAGGGEADLGGGLSALQDVEINTEWADRIEKFGKWVKENWLATIGILMAGIGILTGHGFLAITGGIIAIVELVNKNWEKIEDGFNKAIEWIKGIGDKLWKWFFDNIDKVYENFGYLGVGIVSIFTGAFDWVTKIVAGIVEVIKHLLEGLFKGAKQILDGIIMIFKGDFKGGIISILKGIVNVIIGILNGLISGINAIAYPLRALIAGIGNVLGKSWTIESVAIPHIPYLDIGTNYVPEDQLAMIHKGEAVVPKKFNSKEYFSGANEETNNLLNEVIEAIRDIEINPYTTIKDVGKASLNYINSKSRQLGESVVI